MSDAQLTAQLSAGLAETSVHAGQLNIARKLLDGHQDLDITP